MKLAAPLQNLAQMEAIHIREGIYGPGTTLILLRLQTLRFREQMLKLQSSQRQPYSKSLNWCRATQAKAAQAAHFYAWAS